MIATGRQIRAARAALGWSQEELADRAKIHAKSVVYWERAGAIEPRRGHALERMLAAFRSAGIEVTAEPRPAVFLAQ